MISLKEFKDKYPNGTIIISTKLYYIEIMAQLLDQGIIANDINHRKYKSDINQLRDEGLCLVSLSDDAKFIWKVTVVNLMLNGLFTSDFAPSCGEPDRTLARWMKSVDEHGFHPSAQQSSQGTLTGLRTSDKIKVAIVSAPGLSGYNVWDGSSLADYISREFGIPVCIEQCQRLFRELGFSLLKPQIFPSKGDEDIPECEVLKKLNELEQAESEIISWKANIYILSWTMPPGIRKSSILSIMTNNIRISEMRPP